MRNNIRGVSRGFTLIELLVVIAIIGILSSVVLASLNSARAKGSDAAVKSNLRGLRGQAEIFYDNNSNSYGPAFNAATCPAAGGTTMFGSDVQIQAAIQAALSAGGGTLANNNARCATDGTNYAVSVRLKSNTAQHWCVDSAGAAKPIAAAGGVASWTGVACP